MSRLPITLIFCPRNKKPLKSGSALKAISAGLFRNKNLDGVHDFDAARRGEVIFPLTRYDQTSLHICAKALDRRSQHQRQDRLDIVIS
jgi:hypothetical protein